MCAVTQHLLVGEASQSGSSGFKSRLRLSYLSSHWEKKRFPIFFANLVIEHRQETTLGNEDSTSIGKELLVDMLGIHSKSLLNLPQMVVSHRVNYPE
jgi:hypothetical protein